MIRINKNTYIPGVEETLGTLRMHNSMMPQFVDFDKVMMNINYLQILIEEIANPLFDVIGKPEKFDATNRMKSWLISSGIDISGFNTTKTGISLDEESITSAYGSNTLSDDTVLILQAYQKYSKLIRMRGTLISLLQNPISDVPSCDGHRMLILRPEWHPQNTGRVAMRNPAIMNFARVLQEILTVPEGYVKLHTDSGQVEPRIVYSAFIKDPQIQALIKLYDDAYYGLLHYCTMSEEDIRSGITTFKPMEITDEVKESRQKIKTYGNAVMYGSKSNHTGDPVKASMIKRIGEHPARIQMVQNLMQQINRGVTVFHTAFGTPIDTSKSEKLLDFSSHSGSLDEQKLKLAINNPIQGTAADLMRISVYEANKLLMSNAKKSYIINYVHDAGMFAIHEDDMDRISDDLAHIVSYEVEGWLPITADPEFGRNKGKMGLIEDLY